MARARRKVWALLGIAALTGAALVALAAPASTAGPPLSYTLIVDPQDQEGCELATIDLNTGAVNGLGVMDFDSCADDLAVAPDGTVYGVIEVFNGSLTVHLVRFGADGTPTELGPLTGNFDQSFLDDGGIAFGPGNQLFVQMVTDETACDPGDNNACLYRVDLATLAATLVGPPSSGDNTDFFWLAANCAGSMLTLDIQESNGVGSSGGGTPAGGEEGDEGEQDEATGASADDEGTEAATTTTSDVSAAGEGDVGALISPAGIVQVSIASGAYTATGVAIGGGDLYVVGIDYDRATGTLYIIAQPPEVGPFGSDVGAQFDAADDITIYTLDAATGNVTEVADVADDELILSSLGIPGSCALTFTG